MLRFLMQAAALAALPTFALAETLQPAEAASKDVFIYSFGAGFGGPPLNQSNFNTLSPPYPYGGYLGASYADGGYASTGGHAVASLIQFDLSSTPFTPATLGSATLRLYAVATPGFPSADPTPVQPVTVDVFDITAAWDESAVSWSGTSPRPSVAGSAASSSLPITGVDAWVEVDVTSLVTAWLTTPASNNGMMLIENPTGSTSSDAVWFYSSAQTDASLRPQLVLTALPEPASIAVLTGGVALAALRRRRKA